MRSMLPLLALSGWACAPSPPPRAATCADCHPAISETWSGSHHALAERTVDQVDLSRVGPARVDIDPTTPGGLHFQRVIGVEPLWQPLLNGPAGRLQASSLAWDVQQQAWFDVFTDPRRPGDWGHWSGRGMTWNRNCASCHNTGVQIGWDPVNDTYATTVRAAGITCEACHGQGEAHMADPRTPTPSPAGRDAWQETCEACHIRWTPTDRMIAPGIPLLNLGIPILPGLDPAYQPDGQVVDEDFEAIAFRTSRMHGAGIRCLDCHDGHASRAAGDHTCQRCHDGMPDHSHHPAGSPGASCVACHMPSTTYMQRHVRHDHAFRVPDLALAAELGLRVACDRCHAPDPAMIRQATAWWPAPDAAAAARTRALAAARAGHPKAAALLQQVLSAETQPLWRAALVEALGPLAPDAAWTAEPDGWVRMAAVASLPPVGANLEVLRHALKADEAAVRLQAARALQGVLPPDDPSMAELRAFLTSASDHPAMAAGIGTWWATTGHPAEALPFLQRAVRLDPAFIEGWQALATTLAALGRGADALHALDQAAQRAPDDSRTAFLRSLALADLGRTAEAEAEAARAKRLEGRVAGPEAQLRAPDPGSPRPSRASPPR